MSRSIASRAHRVAEAPDPLMRMRGTQHACKTRVRACVLVLVIGCSGGGDSPDASDPPPSTGGSQWCTHMTGSVGCAGGTAFARFDYLGMGAGSHSVCSRPTLSRTHACSAGCAVNGSVVMGGMISDPTFQFYADNVARLCAEAPEAQVGQACSNEPDSCFPTRARLAADGTVENQPYVSCTNGACSAASSSTAVLLSCADAIVTAHAGPNVTGVVRITTVFPPSDSVCLLAWEPSTQVTTSAATRGCLGDWQCGGGMLCDGDLYMVAGERIGVCKPGPRGMLTPAMLSR